MNWSSEQSAIFDFYRAGKGNLVVEARAGTGKTTTIKEAFKVAPETMILYAVFNKKNQREAAQKITDAKVDVRTLHSLGLFYIKKVWKNAEVDMRGEVEIDRCKSGLIGHGLADNKELVSAMAKLVGFLKNTYVNPTQGEAYATAEQRDILLGDYKLDEKLVMGALAALNMAKTQDSRGRISFDDMVWLPVAMGWVTPKYQMVTIDEAQDMNMPQLVMARQATKGRVIVVGDSRQAIYGFRGAVQDAMSMMQVTLRASSLGLTTTYRCPKSVVKIAQEIVNDYKAATEAPEGQVIYVPQSAIINGQEPIKIGIGDAILSRLNAPLMPLALSLIRKNVPARIEGRDIGKQLLTMIRTLRARTVPDFIARVEEWLVKQMERLERMKNAEKKIEQAQDIAETLKALAQDAEGMPDVESRINTLFQDTDETSKPCVLLSSVHKAKGLEWDRVWLLTETFRRGKGIEEDNIYYVAVTRAKKSLFFVGGSSEKRENGNVQNPPQLETFPTATTESPDNIVNPPPRRVDPSRIYPASTIHDSLSLLAGNRMRIPGEIIQNECKTWVVQSVGPSGARCKEFKGGAVSTISAQCDASNPITMRENFQPAVAGGGEEKTSTSGDEENNMAKTKKAAKGAAKSSGAKTKINKSIKGAAEYVRAEVMKGTNKTDIYKTVLEQWPAFEHDAAGLESRYNTAVRMKKNAAENTKPAPKKAEKAPAKPAKAAKGSKKKSAAPAEVPPAPASSESVPPPRPPASEPPAE